jgi:hypothetical protein
MIKSRRMRWAECITNGGDEEAYRILVGKPEEERPVGIPRCRWVHSIKRDLREIEWGGMDWIELAQDRDQWGGLL